MAAIRKSNLRGNKRWFGRDSTRQENTFRTSRFKENTNLPPLPKSTPEFLGRQRQYKSSSLSNKSSNTISNTLHSRRVKSQQISLNPPLNTKNVTNNNHGEQKKKSIPVMPNGSKIPLWLMRWNSFYRHTSVITFLLVSATLIVYGWTVYSQHLWSKSYKKLQDLQRDERQLTKHDEALKNRMAQEAQKPYSGLVSPTPANTIFLEETTPLNSQQFDRELPETEPQPSNALGY